MPRAKGQKNDTEPFKMENADRERIEFIGQHETATLKNVADKFYKGDIEAARHRMDKLARVGLVAKHEERADPQHQHETRYQLKKAALRELDPERAERCYVGPISERGVQEALKGIRARLKLEAQGVIIKEWVSGRNLTRDQTTDFRRNGWSKRISDGQAIIVDPATGKTTAKDIEVDGQYHGKMLDSKMRGFEGREVIWACEPNRVARVSRAAADYPNVTVMSI